MLVETVLLISLSTVAARAAETCLYLPNLNLIGGTYDEFDAEDIRICCIECSKDTCCRAYTFNKEQKRCYLKSSINYSEDDALSYSGVRATWQGGRAAMLKNVKIDGTNKIPMNLDTQEDCKQYCTAFGMYSYKAPQTRDDKGQCFCHNRIIKMGYNFGFTSFISAMPKPTF